MYGPKLLIHNMDILVGEEMTATIQILIETIYTFLSGHSFGVYLLSITESYSYKHKDLADWP